MSSDCQIFFFLSLMLVSLSLFLFVNPVGNSELSWSENIQTLITLMHSKVAFLFSPSVVQFYLVSSFCSCYCVV